MTQENNPRKIKGKEIAEKNDLVRINVNTYRVRSQSTHKSYNVVKLNDGWTCNCPDHIYRKVCCKHIHAVEFSVKLREEVRQKNSIEINPVSITDCLFCHSSNIKKYGIRRNKSGDIQRYICSDCSKTFSVNIGFEKMKHNPKGVTVAMQLYFSGESLRNVAKSLKLLGIEVSHQTIYNWINKYTRLMESYIEKLTPQVSDVWRADEVFVKVKGDMKYLFALLDDETRFLIAKEVADTKNRHDPVTLFRAGKEVTKTRPRVIITDGLKSYHDAYKKELWAHELEKKTIHIQHIHFQGDMNNNKMERFNGEFRDREKVMRGVKKKDSIIFDGYQIYHNYVRPHMALDNQTPADKVGIKIKGNNKWITIIQNASQ